MDYSLCDQTVTVYRMENGQLQRLVVEGCYYDFEDSLTIDAKGCRPERRFVLIMPGSCQRVFPGDRIYPGVGPEQVDWHSFVPATVPGLGVAQYTRACWWGGDICHVEAGKKSIPVYRAEG